MGIAFPLFACVTSLVACQTLLELGSADEDAPAPGTDAGAPADGPIEGNPGTGDGGDVPVDAAADVQTGMCAFSCAPGGCKGNACQRFVAETVTGVAQIDGVAAIDDRVFYGSHGGGIIGVVRDGGGPLVFTTAGAAPLNPKPTALEVKSGVLLWAKDFASDGVSGIHLSPLTGGTASNLTNSEAPGVLTFAAGPNGNDHHFVVATSTNAIKFREGVCAGPCSNYSIGASPVGYMARTGDTLVWIDQTGLWRGDATAASVPAPTLISGGLQPAGVDVTTTHAYFVERNGAVSRVALSAGAPIESILPALAVPPTHVGDLSLTPNGRFAYWAEDNRIMGVALGP